MQGEHQRLRLHPQQTQTIAAATLALLHHGCRSRSAPQAREGCTAEALISGGFLYSNLATFHTHRRRRRDSHYDCMHSYTAVQRKETVPGYRLAAMECKETLTTHAGKPPDNRYLRPFWLMGVCCTFLYISNQQKGT